MLEERSSMLLIPMLVLLVTPLTMTYRLSRYAQRSPVRVIDLGIAFVWIVFLYSFLPVLGIWLANIGIGALADQRFNNEPPDPGLVFTVASSYAAFMVAFALVYLRKRAKGLQHSVILQVPTLVDIRSIIIVLVAIKLGLFLLRLNFGVDASDGYISSYVVFRGQPILIQQLVGVLTATDFAATLLTIVAVVAFAPRLQILVVIIFGFQIAVAVASGGSRSSAFLCAFAFVVAKSIYDYKLRSKTVAIYAAIGLAVFLVAGLFRSSIDVTEGNLSLQMLQGGEFLAIFYNSLDLLNRLGDPDIVVVKTGIYLVDLLRFIPQQIIGDLKVDPAAFYVSTFYSAYSDAGGGMGFGAIAESTIGFGWPEAFVRGALLGWVYASIANSCLRGKLTVVRIFIYVWFVVMSYQAIRDTTFSTIPRFAMQVLPMLIVLRLTGVFRSTKRVRIIAASSTSLQRA